VTGGTLAARTGALQQTRLDCPPDALYARQAAVSAQSRRIAYWLAKSSLAWRALPGARFLSGPRGQGRRIL